MKLFLDNTFAPAIARAFGILADRDRHAVKHMTDLYPDGDPGDEVWIPALGGQAPPPWIVLTGDVRILRNPQRQKAILDAGLVGVFFAGGYAGLPFWTQTVNLIKWWPKIEAAVKKAKPSTGFWVTAQGKVEPARFRFTPSTTGRAQPSARSEPA